MLPDNVRKKTMSGNFYFWPPLKVMTKEAKVVRALKERKVLQRIKKKPDK